MSWPEKYPWVFFWKNEEKNTDLSTMTQCVIKEASEQ